MLTIWRNLAHRHKLQEHLVHQVDSKGYIQVKVNSLLGWSTTGLHESLIYIHRRHVLEQITCEGQGKRYNGRWERVGTECL